jgi:hypothetical protein
MREVSWTTERDEVEAVLARGQASAWTVLAVDGARAGRFDALGADDGAVLAAVGAYAGSPVCTRGGVRGAIDDACEARWRGCGLAVARLGATGGFLENDPAPRVAPPVGGGCRLGDDVAIDIDGDGAAERFPLAAFVDATVGPADEVTAVVGAVDAGCTPTFALAALPTGDARVELDLLGVVDVDGDGWREVVVSLRYADHRTVAVYSAVDTVARLSLVGEVKPWVP